MKTQPQSSDNWFIVDAPVVDSALDAFGHSDIADNLYKMVTEPTSHRRMIGLFGQFGVGKSSIIELLRGQLTGSKDLKLIRMSAERHEPVGFHRAAVYGFAEALVAENEVSNGVADQILEPLRSAQTTSFSDYTLSPLARGLAILQRRLNLSRQKFFIAAVLSMLAATIILGLGAVFVPTALWATVSGFVFPLVTTSAFFAPFVVLGKNLKVGVPNWKNLLAPGTRTMQRPKVEAADEQERAFAELVDKAKHRLIIAVDDIDRLSKDQILAALNAIRSFQLTCKKERQPIFVVSIDEDIVCSAIEGGNRRSTTDAQEFLNRLFTLRQEVPVHETLDLRDYARTLLSRQVSTLAKYLEDEMEAVIMMLIHEDVNDPRHVVRAINAFSSDFRLARARESRVGSRSIHKGTVTNNLDVLARMVVLKTDYPDFFQAALRDLELIDLATHASAREVEDADSQKLAAAGFNPKDPEHASLFKYLSRTGGWIPKEIDLVPFLYLGQDRFSRTLGNKQARQLGSSLANNQPVVLERLAKEAQAAGSDAEVSFREMVVSIFRDLEPAEEKNAASAILSVADNEILQTEEIARAVRTAVDRVPEIAADIPGALIMAKNASPTDAESLGLAILNIESTDNDSAIWADRSILTRVLGEHRFQAWMERRISGVSTWDDFARWTVPDLGSNIAGSLAKRAVVLAAVGEDDDVAAEASDHANVVTVTKQVTHPQPVSDFNQLTKAMAQPASTFECAIALKVASVLTLTPEQLATLMPLAISKSATALSEDETPLAEVCRDFSAFTIRVAQEAPKWVSGEGANRLSSASIGATVIGEWIGAGHIPASHGIPVLGALASNKASGQQPLAKAIFDAWTDAPDESDSENVPLEKTVKNLASIAPSLEETAQSLMLSQWTAMLRDESTLSSAEKLIPVLLTTQHPMHWADQALEVVVPSFSTNTDFTGNLTNAAAAILATGFVSESVETALLTALSSVASSGGTYRQRALTATSRIPWSKDSISDVMERFSPYASEFESNDYWALFDLQMLREEPNSDYINRINQELGNGAEPDTEMLARVEVLAAHLTLTHSTTLAMSVESTQATQIIATRASAISKDDAPSAWMQLFGQVADMQITDTKRAEFVTILAAANPEHYQSAVRCIWNATLDTGETKDLWKFVTIPLSTVAKKELCNDIAPLIIGSKKDALSAATVIYAARKDDTFDRLISSTVKRAMERWSKEIPDPQVTSQIAQAIGSSKESRAAAQSVWRRKPINEKRFEAYKAAQEFLNT